jgi:hypothetical protein
MDFDFSTPPAGMSLPENFNIDELEDIREKNPNFVFHNLILRPGNGLLS